MSNNNLKSTEGYFSTKKLIYILITNIYFLIAISPFLIYCLALGNDISIYIVAILAVIVGPAISTVFSVLGRVIKGKETNAPQDFLYFYKLNFLQGILAGAIISAILLVAYLDMGYFLKMGVNKILYLFIVIKGFILAVSLYVFPIIARISAKTLDVFKLAIEYTIKKFYLSLTMITIVIAFLFAVKLLKISLISLLFGPVVIAYIILLLEKNILIDAEEILKYKYKEILKNEEIKKLENRQFNEDEYVQEMVNIELIDNEYLENEYLENEYFEDEYLENEYFEDEYLENEYFEDECFEEELIEDEDFANTEIKIEDEYLKKNK